LKFNHAMHMTAGLMHAANGRQSFGIADMPEEFQQRYKKVANEKGQIQLNCESCHELDRTNVATLDGLPGAIGVPRGTGEYYRPVVYEQHCQACHSLPYRPGGGNSPDAHVQHRLNAKQLETRVRDVLLTQLVRETPELQDLHRETIPGNEPPDLLTDTGRAWLEAELNQSAHYLKTAVCAECHETAAMDAMPSLFPDVSTTNVPNVWLKHARFDHSAHRAVACVECHARAYSDKADASRLAKDVLVPNIESCVRCHAPRQDFNGQLIGGARHDCVECHLYHGRDDPNHWLDGKGSVLRGAKARRSIDQLLEQSMPGNDLEP